MTNDLDLFKNTERVTFELSNLCNYAIIHPKCPASKFTEKIVLRKAIVLDTLDALGAAQYSGWITFYAYSEPLIDPRFQAFVERAKKSCPTSKVMVTTNGYMLTPEMADELGEAGLDFARVSAYTDEEFARLSAIKSKSMKIHVRRMGGDKWRSRLGNYTDPINHLTAPCFAPLIDVRITTRGKVGLCCVDYENRHTFADLAATPFLEVMRSGILQAEFDRLTRGDRHLDLCRRCTVSRKHGGI